MGGWVSEWSEKDGWVARKTGEWTSGEWTGGQMGVCQVFSGYSFPENKGSPELDLRKHLQKELMRNQPEVSSPLSCDLTTLTPDLTRGDTFAHRIFALFLGPHSSCNLKPGRSGEGVTVHSATGPGSTPSVSGTS